MSRPEATFVCSRSRCGLLFIGKKDYFKTDRKPGIRATHSMTKTYPRLIEKIDAFTRKYYGNQMLKGGIYFLAIGLGVLLVAATLEYFGQFSSTVRMVMFFGLAAMFLLLFIRYIAIPGLRLLKLGKLISHEEASRMIGKHFPQIDDKLLNTLQLKALADANPGDTSLLEAGIDERIEELKPVTFSSAIRFGDNKKYLKYVLPPLALGVILLIISPAILTEGTRRIVSYDVDYKPKAPFDFDVLNPSLQVPLNEDFELQVRAVGGYVPQSMSMDLGGKTFRLKPTGNGEFSYTFRKVRQEVPFRLMADGFYSENLLLEVLPTPRVVNFQIALDFPAYLGRSPEMINNAGNLTVPEGTTAQWRFSTNNADELFLSFPDTTLELHSERQSFEYNKRITNHARYRVAVSNALLGSRDTMDYRIEVIKDAYPKIAVESSVDSTDERRVYFGGSISDDYGLRALKFHYTITGSDGTSRSESQDISITGRDAQEFFHYLDFGKMNLSPGDEVTYYFEVWDNDGVNGSKSARSTSRSFKAPSMEEMEAQRDQTAESMKERFEQSLKKAAELQKSLDEFNKNLLQKDETNWQDKKQIEDILKQQKDLQKEVEELQKDRKSLQQNRDEYSETNENILKKQEQLQKMFDELMSDEMKDLYRKLEELMEEMDRKKLLEEMENFQMSTQELEKELDRTLEIFKQLEFEQKFEQTMDKLEKLAEEQEKLSEESKSGDKDSEDLKKEQDKLNEEFDRVKEDLKDLEKKNSELERPMDIPDTEDQKEDIDKNMEDASEQLDKNKKNKASGPQQDAADGMKKMQQKMESAMSAQQSQSAMEDMAALRALLENILQLSFDQEDIMENLRYVEKDDPKYVEYGRRQKKLQDDGRMVEDSLFALSKRVPQIESVVNEEISAINRNVKKALDDIGERQTSQATSRQQYTMTSYNNLALLLDEALKQMQMAMANQMPGTGNCENPGGSGAKPSSGNMSKLQEQMGKRLEELQKAMEKGQKPGKGKPGMGDQGMSMELAKMAAEQAAIRKEIEKMSRELNQRGKGEGKGLEDAAKKMEDLERDLVNQEITRQTLERQQDIMIRLLESEKAQREREYDDKRESDSPKPYEPVEPEEYLEYQRKKAREIEFLRTVPPELKPYYKNRVNDYFLNFERTL